MPNILQNIPLPLLAHPHILQAPFLSCHFILAEHAFTGTGDVRQKDVNLSRQHAKLRRVVLRYDDLRSLFRLSRHPFLHVFRQDLCTFGYRFVADKKRAIGQKTLQQSALAARRGTKVEGKERITFFTLNS